MKKRDAKKSKPSKSTPTPEAAATAIRGYRVKLYPTKAEVEVLERCQWELSGAWNKLVGWRREHVDACCAWFERSGEGPARPTQPAEDAAESEWAEWRKAAGAWKVAAVKAATGKHGPAGYGWPKHTRPRTGKDASGYYYGTLREVMIAELERLVEAGESEMLPAASAQAYVSLVERFGRTKGPRPKGRGKGRRAGEWRQMPLHEGSGVRIEWGDYGPGYGACIRFGSLRIRARTWDHGYEPDSLVEGVSIVRERDGWYASVRARVAPRRLPDAEPGSIVGVNLGLRYLVATSDGLLVENPRGEEFSREVARKQQLESEDKPCGESSARYQERAARRLDWILYNEVLPPLGRYETIVLHEVNRKASQGPQCRIGPGHGGYVPAMYRVASLIAQRYGDRVRTVQSVDISRHCSRCGAASPNDFNRTITSRGQRREMTRCPSCRLELQVDVNAARNVVAKYLQSLEAAE